MKNYFLFIPFACLVSIGCNKNSTPITKENISTCDQTKYGLIWNIDLNNAEWRNNYLNYITSCVTDTGMIKQLAKFDGEYGNYTFFIYGMMGSSTLDHLENIYENHPIGFYSPGCDENEYGLLYNEEMKRYLKKNEGLDFDSIVEYEFSE